MGGQANRGTHGPGQGRWCPEHGRIECVHQRSRGRGQCHGCAIAGTNACPKHAGKTVERARADALNAWAAAAGDDGISPRVAVAAMLGLAWRRAELLAEALRDQVQAADAAGAAGMIGHTYSASAAADGIYATGERTRALVELEAAERDRVVRFAETGHRMGIEDQRLSLAEQQGRLMADVLAAALYRLGLDVSDPDVREAVRIELLLLGGQAAGRA